MASVLHPAQEDLLDRMCQQPTMDVAVVGDSMVRVSAESYLSPTRSVQEQALLRRHPVTVGHASVIEAPGACLMTDEPGVSLIIVNDEQGTVRGFLNACRHRGTQLIAEPGVCHRDRFVCPYHRWSYSLAGRLRGVPSRSAFPGLDMQAHGLVEVPVEVRHGLIWVLADHRASMDLDAHLGALSDELESYGIDDMAVYARVDTRCRANWKLLVDAFLESYHVKHLHKGTVGPLFLDTVAVCDQVGLHIRGGAARNGLLDGSLPPRDRATFLFFLFPHTFILLHPDYVSRFSIIPIAPAELRWVHEILVPKDELNSREAHWKKSFELIEEGVFGSEDRMVAERMQRGLETGALEALTFGLVEKPSTWFHETLTAALGEVARS